MVDGATATQLTRLLGDWQDGGPTYERLAATLRALVLDGRLALHTRLPPERVLADALGLSRSTVTAAYSRLRADGYLRSRQGAGSWVTMPGGHRAAPDGVLPAAGIDLRIAALPAPPLLAELAAAATRELPRWLDQHGYDPLGLPPLRRAIARRFGERGLPTRPEQILVTSGGLHALWLVAHALLRRGRTALVEIPSYPAALDALRAAGARLATVPVDAGGWDLDALEAGARSAVPALAYLMPDFQNPTGALVDDRSRRRALRMLEQAGCLVVVDETFAELDLDEQPRPRPAAAHGARTVTIGSLGKAVWGGLRIGWVRADPPLVHRLATARAAADLASPVLEQLVAIRALERLDELLEDRRALARERRAALLDAIERQLPEWRYTPPHGGLVLWAELPHPAATALAVRAREHDLYLAPGPRFGGAGLMERYLRLPFTLPPADLREAVAILARLVPSTRARTTTRAAAAYVA